MGDPFAAGRWCSLRSPCWAVILRGMATSPLSPDEFRAAAEVYRELGPEYSDAVAESFVERVNGEIEARVGARLAAGPRVPRPAAGSGPYGHRLPVTGLAAGAVVTGIPLAFVLVVLQGSAAARADWVQWMFGALLVSAVVSGVVAVARRAQVRGRLAG